MPGAIRFLYGLVMGVSVGIIVSRLIAASGSGSQRRTHRVTPLRVERESVEIEAEEARTQ